MSDSMKIPARADQEHFKAVFRRWRQTRQIDSAVEAYMATMELEYPLWFLQVTNEERIKER